jgi:predicted O-methyltransferase YrrM
MTPRANQDWKSMTETIHQLPHAYQQIDEATKQSGFTMASDVLTGSLLRTLATAKPGGRFLELGTGTGLSTSWILDGMDRQSTLTSIDNDAQLLEVAQSFLGTDERLTLVCTDGEAWVEANRDQKYDYIFADTWHGKYLLLDEVLAMVNGGGFYIVDDMLPQPGWPDGHARKAEKLARYLDTREDFTITKQHWSTGIIVAAKKIDVYDLGYENG